MSQVEVPFPQPTIQALRNALTNNTPFSLKLPRGVAGAAATINVGTTTTGAPGTNASVVNAGTPNNAILDFTIPRGNAGTNGTNGTNGADGLSVLSGHGGPPAVIGNIGEFWIDIDFWNIYGPKTIAGWGAPTSLVGPPGALHLSMLEVGGASQNITNAFDFYLADGVAIGQDLYLPAVTDIPGRIYVVKRINLSPVTIHANGGDRIDGSLLSSITIANLECVWLLAFPGTGFGNIWIRT